MKKVFWSFPSEYDSEDKWKRLEPKVVKQHRWLINPYKYTHDKYKNLNMTKKDIEYAKKV